MSRFTIGTIQIPVFAELVRGEDSNLEILLTADEDPADIASRVIEGLQRGVKREDPLIPAEEWDAAIIPDYAADIRLIDIVAKMLYEERQDSSNRFLGTPWDDQTETVKTRWRDYAAKLIDKETGHGR